MPWSCDAVETLRRDASSRLVVFLKAGCPQQHPGPPDRRRPGLARPPDVIASSTSAPSPPGSSKPASTVKRWALRLGTIGLFISAAGLTFVLFAVASGSRSPCGSARSACPISPTRRWTRRPPLWPEAGLALRIEPLSRIHPTIAAEHVAAQDPAAGLTTRRRRSIKVWLSSGPSAASVPTLIGQSERGARTRLQEDALGLSGIAEIRSSRYPSDAVVAQEPPPLASAATVSLLMNRGERGATYVMPDLIGVYGGSAAEALRAPGFRVTVVGDHPYPGVPPGIVLRQFPRAGFQIAQGETISLEVSR